MMEIHSVYTDNRYPHVELWECDTGLKVRNGRQGKPIVLDVLEDSMEHRSLVAEAFFKGMAYAFGR